MKAEENLTVINVARVLVLSAVFGLAAAYAPEPGLLALLGASAILSLAWYAWERIGLLPPTKYPRTTYVPTFLDLATLTILAYFTGGLGSFVIGGHYFSIAIGSTNKRINHGLYALAVSFAMLAGMGALELFGILEPFNAIGPIHPLTPGTMAFTLACWLAVGGALHAVIRRIRMEEISLEGLVRDSEARYRLIADNARDVIWRLDLATLRYLYVSPSVTIARGISQEAAQAETLEESLCPESYSRLSRSIDEARRGARADPGIRIVEEIRQPKAGGGHADMEASATFIYDAAGTPIELLGASRDISQKLKTREQDETIKLLLSESGRESEDCIWETDEKGAISSCPESMAARLGKPGQSLVGTGAVEAFADASPADDEAIDGRLARLSAALSGREPFSELLVRFGPAREPRYWSLAGRPRFGIDGELSGWRVAGRDVTRTVLHAEEMERLAWVDQATGLGNRADLLRRIDGFFAESPEGGGSSPGSALLALVHIENMKLVNSVFGHAMGDEAIGVFARRVKFICGEFGGIPNRVDGADFSIFISSAGPTTADDLEGSIQILREPVVLYAQTIELEVRIGAAGTGPDSDSAEALLQAAEGALNHARAARVSQTKRFDAEMAASERRGKDILGEIQDAMDRKEFRLLYQPQVIAATGGLAGAESLVRWHNKRMGLVSPGEFIPIAERNGYIVSLGAWIQFQACKDALLWPKPWKVAVNVAAAQLLNRNFSRSVLQILESTGLPPERLKLEITESSLVAESGQAREQLERLRSERIRIALDDFGTGYSSLSYLKELPIDELKIDQSFVRAIGETERSAAIVETIIRLAKNLGLSITAEGAETERQAAVLRELGCDYIQGYLYSKPIPSEDLAAFGIARG